MTSGNNKKSKTEPMTVERLRKHLFGGPQVPFWNYDPTQITIGIEVEYFIAHVHPDGGFTLATKAEYLRVIDILMRDAGYKDHKLYDQPGRVSKDTENGFIAIKPDFAWHILEISFPPRKTSTELRELLTSVFDQVDRALAQVGLERLDISALPDVPEKMELVELDRLSQIKDTLTANPASPTSVPHFPALITATHIHLNVFSEEDLKYLGQLFAIDQKVSKKFTRSTKFRGRKYDDLRTNLYRDALGQDYLLHTIPPTVPDSLSTLSDLMNRSRKVFPGDPFFPVRNMSWIRPTKYGTLEFRSSCSFKDLNQIIEIANWRIAQVILAFADKIDPAKLDEMSKGIIESLRVGA